MTDTALDTEQFTLERPFPQLSPEERAHLDLYGYVVVENVLTPEEVTTLRDKIYELEEDYHRNGPIRRAGQQGPPRWNNGGSKHAGWDDNQRSHWYSHAEDHYFRADNLLAVDDCFLRHVLHPRILGMVEDSVGSARYEQSDAHISRVRHVEGDALPYGFHRGAPMYMAYSTNGRYRHPLVKTLTNLTDLDPDDGGTTVIPGSHKLPDEAVADVIEAVRANWRETKLLHSVVAPAGSTLFFFESLLHSGGVNRSGKDRPFMIAGYCASYAQTWDGYDPDPSLRDRVSEDVWRFLDGTQRWQWDPPTQPFGGSPHPAQG